MNSSSRKTTRNLLQSHRLSPIKGLGQNFLIDKRILRKIIVAADIKPNETILEVGPGTGTLTRELAKKAKKVIVVEKDSMMVAILKEAFRNRKNVKIIQGDILKSKIRMAKPYKVVANLPYYAATAIVRRFLETMPNPESMILLVQKEVGQRICAKSPKMNLLAVSVQFYAQPKIISFVSKKSFWPQPKVDGAIIKLKMNKFLVNESKKQKAKINKDLFFRIVKAGFSQPRKQLLNNLSRGLKLDKKKTGSWFKKNNINPLQRAESLTLKNWLVLTKDFSYN